MVRDVVAPRRCLLQSASVGQSRVRAAWTGFGHPHDVEQVLWYTTCVRITESARRHGISDEAIRHAVGNAIKVITLEEGWFIIGSDESGRMLELVAKTTDEEELVVFHAMPLRTVNARRFLP